MWVEADVAPCEGLQRGPNGFRSLYQLVIPIIPIPMSVGCAAYCLDKIIIHTVDVPNRFIFVISRGNQNQCKPGKP
jgi:hypothetical protein